MREKSFLDNGKSILIESICWPLALITITPEIALFKTDLWNLEDEVCLKECVTRYSHHWRMFYQQTAVFVNKAYTIPGGCRMVKHHMHSQRLEVIHGLDKEFSTGISGEVNDGYLDERWFIMFLHTLDTIKIVDFWPASK